MRAAEPDPDLYDSLVPAGNAVGFSAGLMDKLVDASAAYLVRQPQAGVQIFDTWAGVLPAEEFARWCIGAVMYRMPR
jgi:hypothetical protein